MADIKDGGPKISVTGQKPGIRSFEDFEVLSGAGGLSRDDYKMSTFHSGDQMDGDMVFKKKADLLGSDGSILDSESEERRTETENKEEKNINSY